jgi:hypothetical protein
VSLSKDGAGEENSVRGKVPPPFSTQGKTSLMEESRAKLINYWLKTAVKVLFEQRKSTIR